MFWMTSRTGDPPSGQHRDDPRAAGGRPRATRTGHCTRRRPRRRDGEDAAEALPRVQGAVSERRSQAGLAAMSWRACCTQSAIE